MKRVVVTSISFSKNDFLKKKLLDVFPEAMLNEQGVVYSQPQLAKVLSEANGAIVGAEIIDSQLLKKLSNLKVISKYGVGVDNIDFTACKKAGVKVVWTEGVNASSVAEQTLGFMIALCRNLFLTTQALKTGDWMKNGGVQLRGKKVGVIGVGHIGKKVIELLKPFDCEILGNDIVDQTRFFKTHSVRKLEKAEIFKTADIVTIHTPLTPKTENLINKKTLSLMKKSTFLINTARGAIVNQQDLKNALKSQTIAGAALDVYEEEPPKDLEFLGLPNLICTPHIGGNSVEAVQAMGLAAIENLKKTLGK